MEEINLGTIELCKLFDDTEECIKGINKLINTKLLKEKLKIIKDEVNDLEKTIDKNNNLLKTYSDNLIKCSNQYKDKKIEIISLTLNDVFILINANLPLGIEGETSNDKSSTILKRSQKVIKTNKECTIKTEIGKVICEDPVNNSFKLILDGEDIKKYSEEFKLDSLSRIFKIVACINNNILYKE